MGVTVLIQSHRRLEQFLFVLNVLALRSESFRRAAPQHNLLLFEVSAVFDVEQHQVQVVANGELARDVAVCWAQIELAQEETDREDFPFDWRPVHDLVLRDDVRFGVDGGKLSGSLFAEERNLHVFDSRADEMEQNAADDNVTKVESGRE